MGKLLYFSIRRDQSTEKTLIETLRQKYEVKVVMEEVEWNWIS